MSTITMVTPDRTLRQRLEALEKANEHRMKRAQLKRDMKASRVFVFEVLAFPPAYAATMKVNDLVLAMPKVGRMRATKWLRQAGVSPSKTLGGISPRQRHELLYVLRTRP